MKEHLDAEQMRSMDYKSLQALAKDMGVSAAGKAEDIIARIAAVEAEAARQEEDRATEQAARAQAEAARQEEDRATEQAARAQEEAAQAAAGLVKVKVVTRFLDKQLNQIKDAGEAYSVSRERAAELAAAGVAEIVG